MKLAFVVPWYGENIPGGAEAEVRRTTDVLSKIGFNITILTTCVKDFYSDWGVDHYREGGYNVNGIKVKRFRVRKRDTKSFDKVNAKLMRGKRVSESEERIYIEEMINSAGLYDYIKNNHAEYDYFIFIPYMFGTTYFGVQACPQKSILIPCLHDESYAYMSIYKKMFSSVKGIIFHTYSEERLAKKLYDMRGVKTSVLGEGIDTDFNYNAQRFRSKYHIYEPFILYAGRKEQGKNIQMLIDYYIRFKSANNTNLKLVLIGPGNLQLPFIYKNDIIDLGFIPIQDKFDAYAAATIFCNPSSFESFSIVLMESWLCGVPTLVYGKCEVMKEHCIRSNAGLYFDDYEEFEGCVNFYLENDAIRNKMGSNGRHYVINNYSWDTIANKYINFFKQIEA